MFDDDDRVPTGSELEEDVDEHLDVSEGEARRGLIQDVDGVPMRGAPEFTRQFHSLGLTARECRRRLTKPNVPQAHLMERAEGPVDLPMVFEEWKGLIDGHLEDVMDRLPLPFHFEGLSIVTGALADVAGDPDIREEVHLQLDRSSPAAGLTTTSSHVEREAPRGIATLLRDRGVGEQFPDLVEDLRVRRWIGPRGAADGALIHDDGLIHHVQALDEVMPARCGIAVVKFSLERWCQHS